jgi:hypothetical protein
MRHLILFGVIMILTVSTAFSQSWDSKVELAATGGLSMPTGDWSDGTKNGYTFGFSAGFRPINMLVVGGEIMYYGNGATDDVLAALGTGADVNTNIIQYSFMAKAMFPVATTHNVYAKGIVGGYNSTVKFENIPILGSDETSNTNVGFGIGGGFRLNGSNRYSLIAEGMFHHINGEVDSAQMLTFMAGILVTLP